MSDDDRKNMLSHIEACEACTKANGRVNDFCKHGRILFALWNPPVESRELVEITESEYDALIEELVRQVFEGQQN